MPQFRFAHGSTQLPKRHTCPIGQVTPVQSSTHEPPTQRSPAGQVTLTQSVSTQMPPAVHVSPQGSRLRRKRVRTQCRRTRCRCHRSGVDRSVAVVVEAIALGRAGGGQGDARRRSRYAALELTVRADPGHPRLARLSRRRAHDHPADDRELPIPRDLGGEVRMLAELGADAVHARHGERRVVRRRLARALTRVEARLSRRAPRVATAEPIRSAARVARLPTAGVVTKLDIEIHATLVPPL